MNCDWVDENVSVYLDSKLDSVEIQRFESHCAQCDACCKLVEQYKVIGVLMRQSEQRVDTESIWEQLAVRLGDQSGVLLTSYSRPMNWIYATLATAASLALRWFVVKSSSDFGHSDGLGSHQHASLAVDFQEVNRSAQSEPKAAISKLVAKYQGKELATKATTSFLGYEPALFKRVPEGFTRISTHVLNMPCCKCSASICKRTDGISLIVFEHNDEQPVWFGDSPSIETRFAGRTCKIVESAGQLAVSWKSEDRQITLIGAGDIAEVNEWVEAMQF